MDLAGEQETTNNENNELGFNSGCEQGKNVVPREQKYWR